MPRALATQPAAGDGPVGAVVSRAVRPRNRVLFLSLTTTFLFPRERFFEVRMPDEYRSQAI